MLKQLVKGEKIKLSDISCGSSFEIGLVCDFSSIAPDISCFGIDAAGKLSDDRYFIFYNQKTSPEGAIIAQGKQSTYSEVFSVDVEKLPANIVRLVFVATIDGNASFSALKGGQLDVISGGNALASYTFSGNDFVSEKAIILGEVYNKTVWRMSAVGQGFDGGLSALLKHFGGEEQSSEQNEQAAPPPPPAPAEPKVNLSKVRLDKKGSAHKVNLIKGESQVYHINLQWDEAPEPTGFGSIFKRKQNADLDLGCFWFSKMDGGIIQPLGGNFGSKSKAPFILLDKDDRTGGCLDGENMYIYRPEKLDSVLIIAMIYEGSQNFAEVNARLTIKDGKGGEIFIPLNNPDQQKRFCAVALITNNGTSLEFKKEELYFTGHSACDDHYGFGFSWRAASK